jgi:RimJ/RimL family protein N-acetyltransferase
MQNMSIRLRALCEEDIDNIMRWVNEPAVVGNFAAFSGTPLTRQDELAWVRRIVDTSSERVWSVFAEQDGRYLGQVGIHQIHAHSRVGRLGIVVAARDEMGRGYGTAAIQQALDFGFTDLALHKIWLMVFRHNTRSQGIYRRIGFVEEGVLREEYFHGGTWHDMMRMSVLAHEWRGRSPDGGGVR